jgi:hypothetical protein
MRNSWHLPYPYNLAGPLYAGLGAGGGKVRAFTSD